MKVRFPRKKLDLVTNFIASCKGKRRIIDHSFDSFGVRPSVEILRRRVRKSEDGSQTLVLTLEDGRRLEVRVVEL